MQQNQSHTDSVSYFTLKNTLLAGAVVLLISLFATDSLLMRLETQRIAEQAERRLGAYKTSLQATINRHQYLPRVLATDPRIGEPLAQRMQMELPPTPATTADISHLLYTINQQAGSDEIFVMDRHGYTHWSSNYETSNSFVGKNYGFRPYFRDAMAGQDGFYYAVGATSGIPGLFFSSPIIKNGSIQGVAVIKIDLAPLEQSWQASSDPVWVTDDKGVIFLSSNPQWHYRATAPLNGLQRAELESTLQYGAGPIQALNAIESPLPNRVLAFDLPGAGLYVSFPSQIVGYPWHMHWRMPIDDIRFNVRVQQSGGLLAYGALTVGLLFYRERRRRTDAQIALSRLTAERESHQRAIIQNTDAGLLNLDGHFRPLFINEQAQALFGITDDLDGHTLETLISDWQRGDAKRGPVRAEGIRLDGTRFPILYTLNPIRVGQNDEYILTVQDITELTRAQLALEQANEVLEQRVEERTQDLKHAQEALAQSQKLAALGRMSSAIAHEINQPITALRNYVASSQLLLAHAQPEKVGQNLTRIETLVDRLSSLSKQLRVFSGKRNTGSDWVSLHEPVIYALDLLRPRLDEQGITCAVALGKTRFVQANTMMLEQIIVNILSNAIDALAGQTQGHIAITLLAQPQGALVLQMADNGPGMSQEQQARIFEPFFTTKPVGEGVGLGLAISYSLALDMGADLSVISESGHGTTFSLSFSYSTTRKVAEPQIQETPE